MSFMVPAADNFSIITTTNYFGLILDYRYIQVWLIFSVVGPK